MIVKAVFMACVVLLTLSLMSVPQRAAEKPMRALWMWNGDSLFDNNQLDQFIHFAQAPHGNAEHRIGLVFFSLRGGFSPATWPAVRRVVGQLHDAGIVVHALTGDPSWALEHETPLFRLQQVLDYNAQAEPHQRVHGIQFDIEPYLIRDQWNTPAGFQQLKSGFLSLLAKLGERRDAHDLTLEIGVAIPRWYDQEEYEFLNRDIQALSDYVAIMNYWNETGRLVRDAAGELSTGDTLGKDVYVGVEVQKIDPPTITFYGYTVAEMEAILAEAEVAFRQHESYKGIVIHHWVPYRDMEP